MENKRFKQVFKKDNMIKTHTITLEENEQGQMVMTRKNDGFTAIELIGLFELCQLEIKQMLSGELKPDIIKREVIL